MIKIRKAEPEYVLPALELAKRVFTQFEAPLYSEKAIRKFIGGCVENVVYINNYISQKHLMFIAVDEEKSTDEDENAVCKGEVDIKKEIIVGVVSERSEGKISMLFVDGDYQRQGIATALMDAMIADSTRAGVRRITLEASTAGMPFYLKYGFAASDGEQNVGGFIFTLMHFEPILFSGFEKLHVKKKL